MSRGAIAYIRSLRKHLSPTDVYRFFISRIVADRQAYVSQLPVSSLGMTPTNAFLSVTSEDAAAHVKDVPNNSLMFGIPVAIKDNFCTDFSKWAVPTTCASHALNNWHAPYNAAAVQSLSNAGSLLMGKTNMDEFAMGCGSTDGQICGPVINPWSCKQVTSDSAAVIAGGSSGGSAAAVSAGLCLAAVASDTGGSARLPAAYCGVVGLKPTYGLISRHGLIPLANCLDVPSVVTSSVADAAAVLATWLCPEDMTARRSDATCVPLSASETNQLWSGLYALSSATTCDKRCATGLRIGVPVEYHAPGLMDEVAHVWDTVAGWLADGELSCVVRPVQLPHTPMVTTVYSALCAAEVASNMARFDGLHYGYRADKVMNSHTTMDKMNTTDTLFSATRSHGFGEVVRSRILTGNFFLLSNQRDHYLEVARRVWRLIVQDFQEVFSQVDFLLTPVTLGPAAKLSKFVQLDNRTRTTLDDVCTAGVNLAGIPAVVVPICLSPSCGLPLGLQLIGPVFSEFRLLQLASYVEARANFPSLVDMRKLIETI